MDLCHTVNVKFNLKDLFSDHRSSCLLSIDNRFDTVGDVENFLKEGLEIAEPFYLEASGAWLPSFEKAALIHAASDEIRLKLLKPQSKTEFRTEHFDTNHYKTKKKRKHNFESESNGTLSIERDVDENSFNDSYVEKKKKRKKEKESKMSPSTDISFERKEEKPKKKKKHKERDLGSDGGEQVEIPILPKETPLRPAETTIPLLGKSPSNSLDNIQSSTELNEETTTKRRRFRTRRKKNAKKEETCNDDLSRAKEQAMATLDSRLKSIYSYQTHAAPKRSHIRFGDEDEGIVTTESTDEPAQSSQLPTPRECSAETETSVNETSSYSNQSSRKKVQVFGRNTFSNCSAKIFNRVDEPSPGKSYESVNKDAESPTCSNNHQLDSVRNESTVPKNLNSICLNEALQNLSDKCSQLLKSNPSSRYKVQLFERKPRSFSVGIKDTDKTELQTLSSKKKEDEMTEKENAMDVCTNDIDTLESQKGSSENMKDEDNEKNSVRYESMVCETEIKNVKSQKITCENKEKETDEKEDGMNGEDDMELTLTPQQNEENANKVNEDVKIERDVDMDEVTVPGNLDKNIEDTRKNVENKTSLKNNESSLNKTGTKTNDEELGTITKFEEKDTIDDDRENGMSEIHTKESEEVNGTNGKETKMLDEESGSNKKIKDKKHVTIEKNEEYTGADETSTINRDIHKESPCKEIASNRIDKTPTKKVQNSNSAASKPKFDFSAGDLISFQALYLNKNTMPVLTDEIVGRVIHSANKIKMEIMLGTLKTGKEKGRFSEDDEDLLVHPPGCVVRLSPEEIINPKKVPNTLLK